VQTVLRWIGVPAAFGQAEDDGCMKRGCGCARLVLVGIVALVVSNLFLDYFAFALWGLVLSVGAGLGGAVVGLFAGQLDIDGAAARRLSTAGKIVLAFGTACLVGVFAMMIGMPGSVDVDTEVDATGGTIGPVTVEGRTWVTMEVHQPIEGGTGTFQRWSFVTAELLDAEKEYLASFGGEFWHYAGYDDGYWDEADESYSATLLVPSSGTYYVRLKAESNVGASLRGPIHVEMYDRPWWGNPGPLRTGAYVAFFLGGLLVAAPWAGRGTRVRARLDEEGGRLRFEGQTWVVRSRHHYAYDDWKADEWVLHPAGPGGKTPRYLEYEYEEGTDWDNWVLSRPVDIDAVRAGRGEEGPGAPLPEHVAAHDGFPDEVIYDDRTYTREDAGTAQRDGTALAYHNYEAPSGDFLTVEGEAPDELSAVVGTSIRLRDLSIPKDDASA
jgi:hypothetical protein